jgi:hypothetical protein
MADSRPRRKHNLQSKLVTLTTPARSRDVDDKSGRGKKLGEDLVTGKPRLEQVNSTCVDEVTGKSRLEQVNSTCGGRRTGALKGGKRKATRDPDNSGATHSKRVKVEVDTVTPTSKRNSKVKVGTGVTIGTSKRKHSNNTDVNRASARSKRAKKAEVDMPDAKVKRAKKSIILPERSKMVNKKAATKSRTGSKAKGIKSAANSTTDIKAIGSKSVANSKRDGQAMGNKTVTKSTPGRKPKGNKTATKSKKVNKSKVKKTTANTELDNNKVKTIMTTPPSKRDSNRAVLHSKARTDGESVNPASEKSALHCKCRQTASFCPKAPSDHAYVTGRDYLSGSSACHTSVVEYLQDGRLLLIDQKHKAVKLFTQLGEFVDEIVVEGDPRGIAMLDETTAAIICTLDPQIQLISVGQSLTRSHNLVLDFEPRSITSFRHGLAVMCYERLNSGSVFNVTTALVIKILTRDGQVVKTIFTGRYGKYAWTDMDRLAANAEGTMLYVSGHRKNEVTAMTENGEIVFRYTHRKLQGLWDVATDGSGNVYACGCYSDNIHQLTVDDQQSRIIPIPGVKRPDAISFQPGSRNFVITQQDISHNRCIRLFTLE